LIKEAGDQAGKDLIKEAGDQAGKDLIKEAGDQAGKGFEKEFGEQVGKDTTGTIIGQVEEDSTILLKDVAKDADKLGNDDLAKSIINTTEKDVGKVTENASILAEAELKQTTNPTLLQKMQKFVLENPGTTLGAGFAIALGSYGLATALQSYTDSNEQKVQITCSFSTNNNPTSYLSCPNSSNAAQYYSSESTNDVVIRFYPSLKIVEGDSITLLGANFSPSIDGIPINVKTIISPSCIIINMPNIKTFANTGSFTLHTSTSARILDQASTAIKNTGAGTGQIIDATGAGTGQIIDATGTSLNSIGNGRYNGLDKFLGGSLSSLQNTLGNLSFVFYFICGLICCCILFIIIMKIINM